MKIELGWPIRIVIISSTGVVAWSMEMNDITVTLELIRLVIHTSSVEGVPAAAAI